MATNSTRDNGSAASSIAEHGDRAVSDFRDYDGTTRDTVRELYKANHEKQTYEFVTGKEREYATLNRKKMSVWEAIETLDSIVDDSDPDTEMSQLDHALQVAESIRADGHPRWLQLTGLIHDLGKVLTLFGEPQWAVVGDIFPVGCAFSEAIVYPEYFAGNPDSNNPKYQTRLGVYEEGCGLDAVHLSWGHDAYLHRVVHERLPEEAGYVIRYHSFYPWHDKGAYRFLMNEKDHRLLPWVKTFNPYDLYTKAHGEILFDDVRSYYQELVEEYLPGQLNW